MHYLIIKQCQILAIYTVNAKMYFLHIRHVDPFPPTYKTFKFYIFDMYFYSADFFTYSICI